MDQQGPTSNPFSYLRIPAERTEELEEIQYNGSSDEAFRDSLRDYFRQKGLTEGQKADYKKTLEAKAQEHGAKDASATLANVADDSTFEIVPVVMPSTANGFIGTSLYIDDVGRFKELPLNERASHIAQRDIRGDAFLCSNHDDPAADEWERIDCGVAQFEALKANPGQGAFDTSNQSQMQVAGAMRQAQTICVTEEEATKAIESKADGNKLFQEGDIQSALTKYSECIQLTASRRDRLSNRAEVEAVRIIALSNRALCCIKTGNFRQAELDCRTILSTPEVPPQPKVLFRLAQALGGLKDYEGALSALSQCEQAGGPADDIANLRNEVTANKAALHEAEKKKFSKMFG